MSILKLSIVTPKGSFGPYECDSVHITVSDNLKEKHGGSYGIRAGHANSMFALEKGSITAFIAGKKILNGNSGDGYATVNNNVVNVVVEEYDEM